MAKAPTKPTAKPRAYSYIRFSSIQQAEGGSLARQTSLSAAYCERKGLILDETLSLQDLGVSAFRGDNVKEGALAGFLEACRTGRVPRGSFLIVESLDRISREQIRPALQLFLALQDYGITIVTLQPEREYLPDSADALALIEPLIVFARAHEESAMKSHRRRESWKQLRAKARAGGGPIMKTCPSWLEVTPAGFREKPAAVAAVRRIFELVRSGLGVHRITDQLTAEKVKPIGTGDHWVKAYVYRIISNPAAMGSYQAHRYENGKAVPDGAPIPNHYPAIVSEAEWQEVQHMLQGRGGDFSANGQFRKGGKGVRGAGRKGIGEPNLFTGLVHFATTGEKMHIVHALGRDKGGERKRYRYFAPTTETGRRSGVRIDYTVFEAAILSLFAELTPADIAPPGKPENGRKAEIARLAGRLLDIDNKLERTRHRARTAGDFDAFLDLIQELQDERKQVSADKAELEQEENTAASADLGEAQSLIAMLANAPADKLVEMRGRLRVRIGQLVSSIQVVSVRHGKTCLCAVQIWFRGGTRRRDYFIFHKPGNRYNEGSWQARSLADVIKSGNLDLRKRPDAKKLEKALAAVDLSHE